MIGFRHITDLPSIIKNILLVTKIYQIQIEVRNTILPVILALISAVWIIGFAKPRFRMILIFGLWILSAAQLGYGIWKYVPISDTQNIFPENPLFSKTYVEYPRITVSLPSATIILMPIFRSILDFLHRRESEWMYSKRYGELVAYAVDEKINAQNVSRIDAYLNPTSE